MWIRERCTALWDTRPAAIDVPPEDSEAVKKLLADTDIDFVNGDIILDGEVVNDKIRTPEISKAASIYSAIPEVREKLVEIQRDMGMRKSVIMDGQRHRHQRVQGRRVQDFSDSICRRNERNGGLKN